MSEYKTLDEFFPDGKPDGRKFEGYSSHWVWFQPYYRASTGWYGLNESGNSCSTQFNVVYIEYVEPKKTKNITMYKSVCIDNTGQYYSNIYDPWDTEKKPSGHGKVVGYMTMDVEVEE
jgi:hypothetical protein